MLFLAYKGHWNFLGTGEAFRYIYIGDAGDGELNVSSEGKVDSGIITAGMKETGTGNITVKDKNSVITNLGTNLGYRCLAIAYTTVWVSRSIQIHCILRVRQAVCGCVMSGGTNVSGPVTAS